MGHTLDQWRTKVADLIRDDAGKDLSPGQIENVGIRPAVAQFSSDRARVVVVQVQGTGSSYLSLPAGWVADWSRLTTVEFPAHGNPPTYLDEQSWRMVQSVDDVGVTQILLADTPSSSQYVRLAFTAPWPFPTSDDDDDKIGDTAFEAVAALAASFCCTSLAAEAARSRSMALPTNFSDGRQRSVTLTAAAERYEGIYNRFLGITSTASGGGGEQAPAYGSYDLDPSYASLFHGGRR